MTRILRNLGVHSAGRWYHRARAVRAAGRD